MVGTSAAPDEAWREPSDATALPALRSPAMDPAVTVAALWALFLGSHLVLSHPPVREPLRARFGANAFSLAYSVFALAIFLHPSLFSG